MTLRPILLPALALLAAGCVAPPEYKDPITTLTQSAPREGPYLRTALRVVLSDNTQKSVTYLESSARSYGAWGSRPDFDAKMLTDRMKDVLEKRFKSVAFVTSETAPGQPRADLTMIFDARVTLGSMSFTTNTVEVDGIFLDDAREPLEKVSGKGTSVIPWPAYASRFPEALHEAFGQFEKALDAAPKVKDFVAARAEGRKLVARPSAPSNPAAIRARVRGLPGRAWALVVGINRYQRAERLNYAVADARAVADALPGLGFSEVRLLTDAEATKAEIERVMYEDLKEKMGPDDRLFVFFAGHGITVRLPRGGEEGYLVPVDGDPDRPELTALAMDEVRKMGRRVPAKHIFFAIDACFSGFAATREAVLETPDADLLSALEEPVVQVMTAGRKGQKAVETGGHGLFTRRLLDALRGLADRDGRGFVTASQLAAWLTPRVTRDSGGRQHPQYSALDGEGDFVFILPERAQPR